MRGRSGGVDAPFGPIASCTLKVPQMDFEAYSNYNTDKRADSASSIFFQTFFDHGHAKLYVSCVLFMADHVGAIASQPYTLVNRGQA